MRHRSFRRYYCFAPQLFGALIVLQLISCGTLPPSSSSQKLGEEPTPKLEPLSPYGNPLSYEVEGITYHVLQSAHGYKEQGVASWYGNPFHGQRASSGETYNMYEISAAHKTLPLPSYAKVTNLENGRSITVRINDRGPFVKNRLIDLSYAAAKRLDIIQKGTALVEVTAIIPGEVPSNGSSLPTQRNCPIKLFVQVGAFGHEANAQKLADRLLGLNFQQAFAIEIDDGSAATHKVRIGPLASVEEIDQTITELEKVGFLNSRSIIERQHCSE